MVEWLYEAGIGEARAALVDGGRIARGRIELEGTLRVGTVADARLIAADRVMLESGAEALIDGAPPRLSIGRPLRVAIVREAIPEPGRAKRARCVPASADAPLGDGPDLLARISASGVPVRRLRAHEPDALEAAGWSELLDEAETGEIAFAGGALRMSPTPAMTLFDIDGGGPIEPLAIAAATAVAEAILRHGIGGSIGIDFPSVQGRSARAGVAAAIDAALPQPFERTALNGFGFLQIVRRRARASLPETLRADPVGAVARAALRQIERTPPGAVRAHRLPAAVRARIEGHPRWRAEIERRTGAPLILET